MLTAAELSNQGIDIYGMSPEHLKRVEKIGLWAWMQEYHPVALPPKGDKRAAAAVQSDHLCALGSKCLRAEKRRGFPVIGKSPYCSEKCAGRAKVIEKAAQKAKRDVYLATGGQILK